MSSLGLPITRKMLKEQKAEEAGFDPLREVKAMGRT